MLKINFEFRKGIFFIRLIGELNKNTKQNIEKDLMNLITKNKFKYIVINTNHLSTIDLDGLNYITKIYYLARENDSHLVICDKSNLFQTLLNNNVPNIKDELEVL
jgi:anti-anti-sigma factor